MTFGSLFAGIGGFDLGFERAGMECKWQVEIDPYCQKVLAKHWPDVRRHDDVRTFPPAGDWKVDVICGGFPCQDISNAGKWAGITGERSGLWTEYVRIIRDLRPRYVVVENVAALLVRGMDRVLGDLAACGHDAEWEVLPAAAFGAPHIRERLFILSYPNVPRAARQREHCVSNRPRSKAARLGARGRSEDVPDTVGVGLQWRCVAGASQRASGTSTGEAAAGVFGSQGPSGCSWAVEPDVGRLADGVSDRVDRIRGLGNAVVPQVAEWIGRRIMEAHE